LQDAIHREGGEVNEQDRREDGWDEWKVENSFERAFPELSGISVRVVGGDVCLSTAEGPAHLTVEDVEGPPVVVRFIEGHLEVRHGVPGVLGMGWGGPRRGRALFGLAGPGLIGIGHPAATVVINAPSGVAAELSTVSAPVLVSGRDAPLKVNTVSGALTMEGLKGPAVVRSVSADVDARDIIAPLRATTVSGHVTVVESVTEDLTARTVSGDVVLDAELRGAANYDVHTVAGDVTMRLAEGGGFRFSATSMSGRLSDEFGGEAHRRPGRRTLDLTVGDGRSKLRVNTLSGNVALLRRGSQPAPAV